MDQQNIKKQAKKIIDNFVSELDKVKVPEVRVEIAEDRRNEGEGCEEDKELRKIIMENAPNSDGDCIIAEKAGWEK